MQLPAIPLPPALSRYHLRFQFYPGPRVAADARELVKHCRRWDSIFDAFTVNGAVAHRPHLLIC